MGIPYLYFSTLTNFASIFHPLYPYFEDIGFDSLMLDSNSIIYDIVRKINMNDYKQYEEIETRIIDDILQRIHEYISIIRPTKLVYIAFDGVAPYAKMKQQRKRRYKNVYCQETPDDSNINLPPQEQIWNNCFITPGTKFMNKLSDRLYQEFYQSSRKYKHCKLDSKCNYKSNAKVIVSASDKPGEGEHKIFQYIRDNSSMFSNHRIALYGLDSDLLMLSLLHCSHCKNIYIFRELPEFDNIKSILKTMPWYNSKLEYDSINQHVKRNQIENELLFMDILAYSNEIKTLFISCPPTIIDDFVFLCFLFGNDFLPSFPSFSLKNNGIQVIIDIYNSILKKNSNTALIELHTKKIQWRTLTTLFRCFSDIEETLLHKQYDVRRKSESIISRLKTREEIIRHIPILDQSIEKYINPFEPHWQERYYKSLFNFNETNNNVIKDKQFSYETKPNICEEYIYGLQWVFEYYTNGCNDWKWNYPHHYPPLFEDLVSFSSKSGGDLSEIIKQHRTSIEPEIPCDNTKQLIYVTPPVFYKQILGDTISNDIQQSYPEMAPFFIVPYNNNLLNTTNGIKYQWAFCRYFWEAHIILPDM